MCLWQMKLCKASSIEERAEGGKTVSEIRIKENESIDSALRRFKRSCAKAGTLSELRKREHYESPSVKRRKKSEKLHALRRRSSAKIEFQRADAMHLLFSYARRAAPPLSRGTLSPWIPLRFRRSRRIFLVRTVDEAPRRRGQRSKSQVHAPTFTGNLMRLLRQACPPPCRRQDWWKWRTQSAQQSSCLRHDCLK